MAEKDADAARESKKRGMTLGMIALMSLITASFALGLITRDPWLTGIFLTPTTISAAMMFLARK